MQKDNKILDDLARLGSSALGSVMDAKRELEAMVSAQLEKLLVKMRLVSREEFEVVQAMALKCREENEKLAEYIAKLEDRINKLAPR